MTPVLGQLWGIILLIYEKIIANQGQFQKSTKIVFRGKHVR